MLSRERQYKGRFGAEDNDIREQVKEAKAAKREKKQAKRHNATDRNPTKPSPMTTC
jgi:hypothetical protein